MGILDRVKYCNPALHFDPKSICLNTHPYIHLSLKKNFWLVKHFTTKHAGVKTIDNPAID